KLVSFVTGEAELDRALDGIAAYDFIALVQEFLDRPEFRLFLVDGEIAFAYRKERPAVTGDGTASIRELCARGGHDHESPYLRPELAVTGLAVDDALPCGTTISVGMVSNISAGGRFSDFIEPSDRLRRWCRALSRTVSLRVTGLDVFSESALADPADIVV